MANGTIHIITKDKRTGETLWDEVWCADCVAKHQDAFKHDRGLRITTSPWNADQRACTGCDDSELAPEFKFNVVNR